MRFGSFCFITKHIVHNVSRKKFETFLFIVLFSLLVANVITPNTAQGATLEAVQTVKMDNIENIKMIRVNFFTRSITDLTILQTVILPFTDNIAKSFPNNLIGNFFEKLRDAVNEASRIERFLDGLEVEPLDLLNAEQQKQIKIAQCSFRHVLCLLPIKSISINLYLAADEKIENMPFFYFLNKLNLIRIIPFK